MLRPWSHRVFVHWQTWRPYTLAYPGVVALAGAGLGAKHADSWRVAGACLAVVLCWVGAHYAGDYVDRRLDAIAKPHRPIPSGRLSARAARDCAVLCFGGFVAIGAVLDPRVLPVALALVSGAIAYGAVFKRRGIWGHLVRGLLTGLAVLFAVIAVGGLSWTSAAVAITFTFHDACSNLIGSLRDVDGDRSGGCRTFAVRHGVAAAIRTATVLYGLAIAAGAVALIVSSGHETWALAMFAAAAALGAITFARLHCAALTPAVALRAHEALCSERLVLAGAFVILGLGPALGLAVTAGTIALSAPLSHRMRRRYEFDLPPLAEKGAR